MHSTAVGSPREPSVRVLYVSVDDDVDIFCRRAGLEHAGPTLVFLHGFRGCHADFAELESILARRYSTAAIDFRFHGLSSAAGAPLSAGLFASDLEAVIERLGVERPVLVGHSLGASVGMIYAGRHPHGVTALVLLGASARYQGSIPVPEAHEDDFRGVQRQLFDRAAPLFFHEHHPEARDRLAATWLSRPYSVHRATTDVPSPDLRDVVTTLRAPTLVIVGGDSPSKPVEEAEWLSEHLPRAELELIPGTRHLTLIEEPGLVAARIEKFFREVLA